jgi:glycine/D-amino acid oxidase-like deaminating enzyme
MARIAVMGAGVAGLSAAMLLAHDGHDVVVVERDPAPPPQAAEAWDGWDRAAARSPCASRSSA